MKDFAIDVRGLRFRQGAFELKDIDLRVPRGYIAGFAGPNGAGKTTTIRTILGLTRPSAGTATVLGGLSAAEPRVKERIGVVLDHPTVAPEWKVASISGRLAPFYRSWNSQLFASLLSDFHISPTSRGGELSRGQGVKLSLAMAMAHEPDLLILDEPSTGLDPVSRAELADLLRSWMEPGHRSVLFSTHITAELDNLADYIYIIHDGGIVVAGELEVLRQRYAIARGVGTPPSKALPHLIGLRQDAARWDALIDVSDTALFGPDVLMDPATTDDMVVYFARQRPNVRTEI